MPSKQTAAMDKAQRLYMAGETNIKALAKKCKVDPSSIYRAKWYVQVKAGELVENFLKFGPP